MDAAGDFTSCPETFNDFSIFVNHLSLRVDLDATHGMVNRCGTAHGVVWPFVKIDVLHEGCTAKLRILLRTAHFSPLLNSLNKFLWFASDKLCESLDSVRLRDFSLLDQICNFQTVFVQTIFVDCCIGFGSEPAEIAIRLGLNGFDKVVATFQP